MTLDDIRHPHLGARVWGYDRDEVDSLLATVVISIERLQRRRHRDAAALEALTREAESARARRDEAERRVADLSWAVEVAERAAADGERRARQAEQRAADAEERAVDAQREAGPVPVPGDEHLQTLPLAQRAARALLREARVTAASIVSDAEDRARAIEAGADPELPLSGPTYR